MSRIRRPLRENARAGGSTFGYKAHVGVDEGSGLISSVITTPANAPTPRCRRLIGDEQGSADAAYHTHARLAGKPSGGAHRSPPQHTIPTAGRLSSTPLIARRRAAFETPSPPQTAHEVSMIRLSAASHGQVLMPRSPSHSQMVALTP